MSRQRTAPPPATAIVAALLVARDKVCGYRNPGGIIRTWAIKATFNIISEGIKEYIISIVD